MQVLDGAQHRGQSAFNVTRSPSVNSAVQNGRQPGIDRHVGDRHCVLMGLEEQKFSAFGGRQRSFDADQNIVTFLVDELTDKKQAPSSKQLLQIIRHAVFEKLRPRHAAAHGVYAGNCHQLAERLNKVHTHRRGF